MKIYGIGRDMTLEESLLAIAGGKPQAQQPAPATPAQPSQPQPGTRPQAQQPAPSANAERARREAAAAAAAEAERKRVEAERQRKAAEAAAEAARKAQAAAAEAELRRRAQIEAERIAAEEKRKLDSLNQELTDNAKKALAPKDTGLFARLLLGAGGGFAVGGPPGAIIGAAALALLGKPKESSAAPAGPVRPAVAQSQQVLVDPGFNVTPPPSATTGRPESVAPPVSGGRQPAPGAQLPGAGTSMVTSKPAAPTGFNPVASGVRMPLRGLHDVPVELYVESLKVE